MITNATATSYTPPKVADARGGFTAASAITFSPAVRCCVDNPSRSQLLANANQIQGIEAVMYLPAPISPEPAVEGSITFQTDGGTEESLKIARIKHYSNGAQSHFEILLKAVA